MIFYNKRYQNLSKNIFTIFQFEKLSDLRFSRCGFSLRLRLRFILRFILRLIFKPQFGVWSEDFNRLGRHYTRHLQNLSSELGTADTCPVINEPPTYIPTPLPTRCFVFYPWEKNPFVKIFSFTPLKSRSFSEKSSKLPLKKNVYPWKIFQNYIVKNDFYPW